MNSIIKDRVNKIEKGIVPEGYKKTKIGIIPVKWEVRKLGEVSEIYRGASPRPISDKKWFNQESDVGWVRISDVTKSDKYLYKTEDYLSEKGIEKSRFVEQGNVIMSICATVGKPIITQMNVCIHDGFIIYKNPTVDKNYLYNYLYYIENKWMRYGQTGSQMNLNVGIVSNEFIPTPLLEEQVKIADILSTWDKAIENIEKLIKEKEIQKKGFMQQLLTGETRLPGFSGEWVEVKLGEVSKVITGTTPSTKNKEYYGFKYPWVTPTDIGHGKYIKETERSLSEEGIKVGRFVPKHSLLITCIASIGKNVILKVDGSCNQQINAIYPSENHSNEYFYYKLSYYKNYLLSYASKTATLMINKNTFENIRFTIPRLAEQKAIAEILSTADKEIELLNKLLEYKKEEKKGLMQLLLTGIVRV